MQNVFLDTRELDVAVRNRYGLSEDIMMEEAAKSVHDAVLARLGKDTRPCFTRPSVLVLAGPGNNGADGYAIARQLMSHETSVTACEVGVPNSEMCKLQSERAKKIGVRIIHVEELDAYLEETSLDLRVIVDCIYGSGFRGKLPPLARAAIMSVNQDKDSYKIACDMPTGFDEKGRCGTVFHADETITMGALKLALFSDKAKDECGLITVSLLGVSRDNFERGNEGEPQSDAKLLEVSDMELPYRRKQNVNKGSFGHVAICSGQKAGASVIAAEAALHFGAGLVSLVSERNQFPDFQVPYELLSSNAFPSNTNAVAVGMGIGRRAEDTATYTGYLLQNPQVSAVLDADVFYNEDIMRLLNHRPQGLLLTPHPKEFFSLLQICGLASINGVPIADVQTVVDNRIDLATLFCKKYRGLTLLLKGANTLICSWDAEADKPELYINTQGNAALAKAGSGDVLAGLAAALLAQGYTTQRAAITASLAHACAAANALKAKSGWALTPGDLINEVSSL